MFNLIKSNIGASLLLTALIITFLSAAVADEDFNSAVYTVKQHRQYMLSAVLKKNGGDTTIRLIQSVEIASSQEEAIGILFKKINKEFEGYTIVDSLATAVPAPLCNMI